MASARPGASGADAGSARARPRHARSQQEHLRDGVEEPRLASRCFVGHGRIGFPRIRPGSGRTSRKEAVARKLALRQAWLLVMKGDPMAKRSAKRVALIVSGQVTYVTGGPRG